VAISAAEAEAHKSGDFSNLDRVEDWQNFKMPFAPYEGMGPLPPKPLEMETGAMTRMFYVPESYFKALEPRLGYSGGYTLFFGFWSFLLSKEILIFGPETGWALLGSIGFGYMFNYGLFPYTDREEHLHDVVENNKVKAWKEYKMDIAASEVDGIARLKEQADGLNLIQEQRKTNLALSLDAEFMNRQADLTESVKKQLDYHVAVKNAEKDVMSKHMIGWIEREVASAIKSRSAASDLNAAISQLKSMAKA